MACSFHYDNRMEQHRLQDTVDKTGRYRIIYSVMSDALPRHVYIINI